MAIGRRKPEQQTMWINQHQLPKGQGHPFYSRLNGLLAKDGFENWRGARKSPPVSKEGLGGAPLGADDPLGRMIDTNPPVIIFKP